MGEYKRLISYIYSYDRGVKGKNAGFAKIESRNGLCRIHISVQFADDLRNETEEDKMEVYFFSRNGETIEKHFLDNMQIASGYSTMKLTKNLEIPGKNLSDLSGIFICSPAFLKNNNSINLIYASEWDDIPITVEDFRTKEIPVMAEDIRTEEPTVTAEDFGTEESSAAPEKAEELHIAYLKEEEYEVVEKEISGQEDSETIPATNPSVGKEADPFMEKNKKAEEQREERTEETEEKTEGKAEEKEEERTGEKAEEEKNPGFFQVLSGCYPKVRLNEIDGVCIKITPHDISYLPSQYRSLCNNSFLLHGYYNYRYLILCEKMFNGVKRYLIGVPGLYHQKEQTIARMFGFTEFEGNKRNGCSMNFGYWCMYLD